jgi:hypothetical protein
MNLENDIQEDKTMIRGLFMLLFAGVLLTATGVVVAQPPAILWQMQLPHDPHHNIPSNIELTPDGDLVFGVLFGVGRQASRHAIVKMTPTAEVLWIQRPIFNNGHGEYADEFIYQLDVDDSGNVWWRGQLQIPGPSFSFLARSNPEGSIAFQRLFPREDRTNVSYVFPLSSGQAMVLGGQRFQDTWPYYSTGILGQVAADGQTVWRVDYVDEQGLNIYVWQMIHYLGGYLIAGSYGANDNPNRPLFYHVTHGGEILDEYIDPEEDSFLINYGLIPFGGDEFVALFRDVDHQYRLRWYDGLGLHTDEQLYDLYQPTELRPFSALRITAFISEPFLRMPDGGFLIAGQSADEDARLIRTDTEGAVVWEMNHNDPIYDTLLTDVILLGDGRIQCAGVKYNGGIEDSPRTWLVQLAAEGEVVDGGPKEMKPFDLQIDD